ncbi:MAG: SDR family NAD(P)-dependent oxidoreductase [Nitrospinae bacterium]|nr:SDR family NAD(P)-dependent oxidoreductase [Nitrospinota bacterium]
MNVNLSGAFYCARAVSKPMADRGKGKIINVASGFGMRAGRDIYMYCCSKGGMIQLTKVLSFNLARYGITANSIVPGFIPTTSTDSEIRSTLPRSGEFLPIGKLGVPEDFGPVADQIVVVDTGSTDRTVDVARRYGAEVHHHPWQDDFSEARNWSLNYARGRMILWVDADDRLEPGVAETLRN